MPPCTGSMISCAIELLYLWANGQSVFDYSFWSSFIEAAGNFPTPRSQITFLCFRGRSSSWPGSVSLSPPGPSCSLSERRPQSELRRGDDPHDGSTDTPWASLMPRFSRAFTPKSSQPFSWSVYTHACPLILVLTSTIWDTILLFDLGKFLKSQEIWSWAPFPYSRPQALRIPHLSASLKGSTKPPSSFWDERTLSVEE